MDIKLTTPVVAWVTGASERQLRHWAKTRLLEPSAKKHGHRLYTFPDVVAASTAVKLRAGGCSLQRIRKVVRRLTRQFASHSVKELARLSLLADGKDVYVLDERQLIEAVTGQTAMFFVLRIGPVIDEAQQRTRTLRFEWTEPFSVRGSRYTLVVTHDPDEQAYSVQCRELPGAIEQGDTPEEAIKNGSAAIESVLDFLSKRRRSGRGAASGHA
jgi:predicted RNase H-like HicB family nuclease/DNA-binding transcriptional MerR regulator